MELTAGMAFRCMAHPRHIHVPLFDPSLDSDEMLLVNFTTLRESCIDDACTLSPADYDELTHATTVAYSRSVIGKKSLFVAAIKAGHFIQLSDLSSPTWSKIIAGGHRSEELSGMKKRLLPKL